MHGRQRLIAALVLTVGLAAAGITAWLPNADKSLIVVVILVVAAVTAVLVPVADRALESWRQRSEVIARKVLGMTGGRLPQLGNVSLDLLGVRTARQAGGLARPQIPYVNRHELDLLLEDAMTTARFVLVQGPSASGKSRTTAEIAKRLFPNRSVLIPVVESGAIAQALDSGAGADDMVVWLDDLDRHMDVGLSADLIRRLLDGSSVLIVATMRAGAYERYKPQGDIRPPGRDVTDLAHIIDFSDWDAIDRRHARLQLVSEADIVDALDRSMSPSEYLSAGPDLIDRLERGSPPENGVAVVRAAADWFRAGLSRPVPLHVARILYPHYLPADDAELLERFEEALDWACQPTSGVRIITRRIDDAGLIVHDYVLDHLEATLTPRLPSFTWETIADELVSTGKFDDHAQVGATAYLLYQAPAIGERLTRRAAENGYLGAMINLANILADRGDTTEAERWYVKAHEAGYRMATYNLALMRHEQDRIEEAEQLYRIASADAVPEAMANLGNLLAEHDKVAEAKQWWLQAAARGVHQAMFNLGRLAKTEGRVEEAERWWRALAEAGDSDAMNSLGVLLSNGERAEESERWWIRAAKEGNAYAMNNLANLLAGRDEFVKAEQIYRTAIAAGHVPAMNGLAVLLSRQDQSGIAERWFRAAASAGDIDAMKNLSHFLAERGEIEEADRWLHRAKSLLGPVDE